MGLLLGVTADAVWGDPAHWHPVAGFGRCATAVERLLYADRRRSGATYTAVLVGGAVALGAAAEAVGRRHPVAGAALTAGATWTVLGGTSLARHGDALARELGAPSPRYEWHSRPNLSDESATRQGVDLDAARARLPSLCGRDPSVLDAAGLARAGVESLAENTSDAVVAPLLWGAVAGMPGLLGYRAVNTLDAMVGYRSPRYGRFGWASARLDDLANLVPARVTALLFAALAPAVGGSPAEALRAWRRDSPAHPSPNAGPVEAAAAGALGIGLGGRTAYPHGVEDRPRLGSGPPPNPGDLLRAARLSRLVGAAAALLSAVIAVSVHGRPHVAANAPRGQVRP